MQEHRKMDDKKGGGLLILSKNKTLTLTKQDTASDDVLAVLTTSKNYKFKIILTYMSTNDHNRNQRIKNCIEDNLAKEIEMPTILLGDFNGHLGFIGEQRLDRTGKLVLDIMENHNLILLNGDDKCEGQTTWSRNHQKSAIDFAFVNQQLYMTYKQMTIDENKTEFDLSDHHLITITFNIKPENNKMLANEIKTIEYIKINEDTKKEFLTEVNNELMNINVNGDISKFEIKISKAADSTLKKTLKKKIHKDIPNKTEKIWFNKSIQKEISIRRQYNKKKRHARTQNDKAKYQDLYLKQKIKVQELVREAVENYEKKETAEIMNNPNRSKKLWENIKKLRGDEQKSKANIEIYNENGNRITEIQNELETFWKTVYQKQVNDTNEIWNNEIKTNYDSQMLATPRDKRQNIMEHLDMAIYNPQTQDTYMRDYIITELEIKDQLRKTKSKKKHQDQMESNLMFTKYC